jgi:hypothetical protein
MRRHFARFTAALAVMVFSLCGGSSLNSMAQEQDAMRPSLSDLMVLTQLRLFKLWYAERVDNWKLASYQLDQLQNTIDRIVKLYPTTASIAQANWIHEKTVPALAGLRRAVAERNKPAYETAYVQITNACNECHKAAGVDFIEVRVPTRSPFANQDFPPPR